MNLLGGFKQWLRLRKMEQEMTSFAIGMNSSVDIPNDKHVVVLDFDISNLELVEQSVVEAQQFWALSDMYVFTTTHGFHVIGWYDQIPYSRLRMIIDYTANVDTMFRYISRFYNKKTLRVAGKYKEPDIHFLKVIPGVRTPSVEEYTLGELKRREHRSLIGDPYEIPR